MTRISTFLTTAALIAASAQFAAAEKASTFVSPGFGEQVEVKAATVYSPKELAQRGLSASDTVTVTKSPAGQAADAPSSRQ